MKRHKWKDNGCERCGLTRELRLRKTIRRFRSALRYGVWEDIPVYDENLRFYYGDQHRFDRPDCDPSTKPDPMLAEVNAVKKYMSARFGDNPVPGTYAVPSPTNRGNAFMKVVLDENMGISDFSLWWDEEFTRSWYDLNYDGTKRQNDAVEPVRYKLLSDDDGHDFIVPVSQEEAFQKWLESVYDENNEDELPMPEGIISIGGSPTKVTFTDPQLNG